MSETDDTDVLLLIPPGFFIVNSSGSDDSLLESSRTVVHKPKSCTAIALNKLVNQVQSLESRLESVENITSSEISSFDQHRNWDSDSLGTHSIDRKSFTFPRRRRSRKSVKKSKRRDTSLTSLDSSRSYKQYIPPLTLQNQFKSPARVTCRNKLSGDQSSMDDDLSSIVSTPSKKTDKLLLHEIDEFLTKVESYESPETKYKTNEMVNPESVIKATGDYITNKIDSKTYVDEITLPSGRIIPSNILDRYIYLVKNEGAVQSEKTQENIQQKVFELNSKQIDSSNKSSCEQLRTSQETKSPSVRKLNFSPGKDVQPTSTPKKFQSNITNDSFKPSTNKIYDRASRILEEYKSHNSPSKSSVIDSSRFSKDDFKFPQMRPYIPDSKEAIKLSALQHKYMDSIDTDLISLGDLWGENGAKVGRGDSLKLEEEKLKREHCETMIQQLQKKILEQQEKLAVAVKVDRAKDAAITKLREAWLKLTSSLDKAEERHRSALEKMVQEVDNFKCIADDAQKKTNHFETELYKALDLAHDYQDKFKELLSEKKEYQEQAEKRIACKDEIIVNKDKEINILKDNLETVMRLNKQATDCIKNLEDVLEKEKSDHESTRSKQRELNRRLESINEESTLIQQERDLLKDKVNEERSRCNIIERQLCEKQNQSSELLKKCDTLEVEAKTLRKHIELQKNELKTHYQKQLEDAVISKLQEFQIQLEQAERDMENDARVKENSLVDTYNKQIARIEEQHQLEIKILEEKQREEVKLYRLQLAQASEKIGLLESKVDSFRRRRGALAAQLHGVMQAQWRQAMMLLTHPHGHTDTASTPVPSEYLGQAGPSLAGLGLSNIPPLSMPPVADRGLSREDKRLASDSLLNLEGLSDTELQQYVKLLLTKPPNLDGSGDSIPPPHKINEEPTSDKPDRHDRTDKNKRAYNTSKPPWKS